jgi:hypothetical protein
MMLNCCSVLIGIWMSFSESKKERTEEQEFDEDTQKKRNSLTQDTRSTETIVSFLYSKGR